METDLSDLLDFNGPPPIPAIMTEGEIASFLGITAARVRTLARDGVLVRSSRGRYDVRPSLNAYVGKLRAHAASVGRPTQGGDALKAARIAKMEAETEIATIKAAQARCELVDAAEVTRQWETTLTDIRAALLAIPGRLQGVDRDTMTRVDGEVRAVLMGLVENG
jgi:phage terminase Nu1 subunit (DNA packaging protein)